MRTVVALMLASILVPEVRAADWRSIKPQTTSETEVVAAFGSPDEVLSTFPWAEWSATWKKRPAASRYTLRYTAQGSKSELLVGPGGPADDAEVHVAAGRVLAVVWHYGGPSARAAGQQLRADSTMTFGPSGSVSQASSAVPGGVIFAELGVNDTSVEVRLELK